MHPKAAVVFLAFSATALLAACTTQESAAIPGNVVQQTAVAASDGSCSGALAEFSAIIDNDRRMGHVAESVYSKAMKELDKARTTCSAGHGDEARRMLATTKKRYGYS